MFQTPKKFIIRYLINIDKLKLYVLDNYWNSGGITILNVTIANHSTLVKHKCWIVYSQ